MASILIVDDDEDTREALRDALALEGFDVRLSAGGREAIAEVSRPDAPGLVFLDATMPGMSGEQLLDWMSERQELDRIPVVLVSGDTTRTRHRRAAALLCKPYDLDVLLRVATELCGPRQTPAARPAQKS